MLGHLVNLIRRQSVVPDRCPACLNSSIPLEALGQDRFLCLCCAKDFRAVLDAAGDFVFDLRPLRQVAKEKKT